MAKILVCDNERDTCDMIKLFLEKDSHKIVIAVNGKGCLEQWEKEKPDLILLDIMMPDLSGWDVYQRIRKVSKEQKVAFVSILEVSPERKQKLLQEGLSDYILKPFTEDELLEKVKAILGK